jgi:hypothetical protein
VPGVTPREPHPYSDIVYGTILPNVSAEPEDYVVNSSARATSCSEIKLASIRRRSSTFGDGLRR